jgi:hypothetical protein
MSYTFWKKNWKTTAGTLDRAGCAQKRNILKAIVCGPEVPSVDPNGMADESLSYPVPLWIQDT